MKKSDRSPLATRHAAFIVAGMLAMAAANLAHADAANDTYTWSAELISVDQNARTAVVQSSVIADIDYGRLARGDRVTLTWSGITTAAGVRRVTEGAAPEADWLTLPVQFVSSELDGRYIRFSVPVPHDDLAKVAALSPGQWITVTSPRRATNLEEAVVDLRPYNDVG